MSNVGKHILGSGEITVSLESKTEYGLDLMYKKVNLQMILHSVF